MTSGKVMPADEHSETAHRFDELVASLVAVDDPVTMAAFLRDLCTTAELDALGQRLQVARLVNQGLAYHEVSRRTGASTATVTRVAHWLRYGEGGYRAVLAGERP